MLPIIVNNLLKTFIFEFERKIIEQISICENRVLFLKNELIRAKNKLGKITHCVQTGMVESNGIFHDHA